MGFGSEEDGMARDECLQVYCIQMHPSHKNVSYPPVVMVKANEIKFSGVDTYTLLRDGEKVGWFHHVAGWWVLARD